MLIVDRDQLLDLEPDGAAGNDLSYVEKGRARRGVPQFLQPQIFLGKGWQLAQELLPGVDDAALAAGVLKIEDLAGNKEVLHAHLTMT